MLNAPVSRSGLIIAAGLLWGGCGGAAQNDGSANDRLRDSHSVSLQNTELGLTLELPGEQVRTAHLSCLGDVSGTGYLSDTQASGSACITVNISGPVNNYLATEEISGIKKPESRCPLFVRLARENALPAGQKLGKLTIDGTFAGYRTHREIDARSGRECDVALWKLMQPLITPSREPLIMKSPE